MSNNQHKSPIIPKKKAVVTDESTAKRVSDFMEAILEDDDVSEVYTNAEM